MPLNVGYIQVFQNGVTVTVQYNPAGNPRAVQPLRQTGGQCLSIENPDNLTGEVQFTGPDGVKAIPLSDGTRTWSLPQVQSQLALRNRGDVGIIDVVLT